MYTQSESRHEFDAGADPGPGRGRHVPAEDTAHEGAAASGSGRGYRQQLAGATLIYGPRAQQPDLILAAQFLIDDLRADGERVTSMRANRHTLRLRMEGMELALALSAGPLPVQSLRGLRRVAGPSLLPAPAFRRAARDDQGEHDDPAMLTDLGTIRVVRALRQHRAALGVLLRRRGLSGAEAPPFLLQRLLDSIAEVAPPSLILWQQSGLVFTPREFRALRPADLAAPPGGTRAVILPARFDPLPVRGEACPDEGADVGKITDAQPAPPVPRARQDRLLRRSAGRLFRRPARVGKGEDSKQGEATQAQPVPVGAGSGSTEIRSARPVLLPRLDRAQSGLADALRNAMDETKDTSPARTSGWRGKVLLGLWFSLVLPAWSDLVILVPGL